MNTPIPKSESVPSMLEEYRLVRLLGRGAMGEVWLAHDTLLDRAVAIKLILEHRTGALAKHRFAAEARAIARVADPNVVSIYRIGESAGKPFLVSEYIRGQTLGQLAKPVSSDKLLTIAIDLARGLAAAHNKGVLHRDIKADNALIGEDGVVKLLDFGLAKLLHESQHPISNATGGRIDLGASQTFDGNVARRADVSATSSLLLGLPCRLQVSTAGANDPDMTHAGTLVGTPRYMAPECWKSAEASAESDIYSLGVLLYELASGRVPHPEEDVVSLRHAVLSTEAAPLVSCTVVEPRFAAIVDRCLSMNPAGRYQDGGALCEALEQLLSDDSEVGTREGNPYRGLSCYGKEDRAIFFGRNRETQALLSMLTAEPLIIVAGESGVGKSSLCLAGVLPLVQSQGLRDTRDWRTVSFRPGHEPVTALADALSTLTDISANELLLEIGEQPGLVSRWLRNHIEPEQGVLLVVDQLEELITQSNPSQVEVFSQILRRLSAPTPGVRVLLTARGDFLTRIVNCTGLSSVLARSLFVLAPLQGSHLRAAIVGPAECLGVTFESTTLVDALAEEVENSLGALPLLQFALSQLWEHRDVQAACIRTVDLEELGGLKGILQSHADAVITAMSRSEHDCARKQLMMLVSSDGTAMTRTMSELETVSNLVDDAKRSLGALIASRLVVVSLEKSECRLAHETLIGEWSRLSSWLGKNARKRDFLLHLDSLAAEWKRLNKGGDTLLRARQLHELSQLKISEGQLSPLLRQFVQSSRNANRRKIWLRTGGILAIPIFVAMVYGLIQYRSSAEIAQEIATKVEEAESLMAEASIARANIEPLQKLAYPLFYEMVGADSYHKAETAWGDVLKAIELELSLYEAAALQLESALLMEGDQHKARHRYGELLYLQALAAERDHRKIDLRRHVARLKAYDVNEYHMSKWNGLGTILVESPLAESTATLYEFVSDSDNRTQRNRISSKLVKPTAAAEWKVAPGSYLVELRTTAPEIPWIRYPAIVERNKNVRIQATLSLSTPWPKGFVYVPEGHFLYGSSASEEVRKGIYAAPMHKVALGSFWIAKTETTMEQWIRFVEDSASAATAVDVQKLLPKGDFWGTYLELKYSRRNGEGDWTLLLKNGKRYEAMWGQKFHYDERTENARQDWRRFPVMGISAEQAIAYIQWLRKSSGLEKARLCTEQEYERAARGADAREYPHGDVLLPEDANHEETYGHKNETLGPDEVVFHSRSDSPFGISDLTGNASEFYRIDDTHIAIRGGSWSSPRRIGISNRIMSGLKYRDATTGFRVCLSP